MRAIRAWRREYVRSRIVALIVFCRIYRLDFDAILATALRNTEGFEGPVTDDIQAFAPD